MQPRGVNGGSASKSLLIDTDARFREMRLETIERVSRLREIIGGRPSARRLILKHGANAELDFAGRIARDQATA